MKTSEIQVGKTYVNRGAGRTARKVIAIGNEHRPLNWFGEPNREPNEPGVLYEQKGIQSRLYLSMFAQWAGRAAA